MKEKVSTAAIRIARVCHEANRAYCESIGDDSQPSWNDAPDWQKSSAIKGVLFRIENPGATDESMHKSWWEQKIQDGWKYGPAKNPETKEHPCMVPYSELPSEQRKKDALFSGIVDALT